MANKLGWQIAKTNSLLVFQHSSKEGFPYWLHQNYVSPEYSVSCTISKEHIVDVPGSRIAQSLNKFIGLIDAHSLVTILMKNQHVRTFC